MKKSKRSGSSWWEPGALWKPIDAYFSMDISQLTFEIAMLKKDLKKFEQSNKPKEKALVVEARNRLNVLFQLYSKKTGRSLKSVLEDHGFKVR